MDDRKSEGRQLNRKEIAIIVVACLVAYLPFITKGVTYDDFVFLDYAKRLTKNPTVCEVSDYVWQGVVLEDLVVFESTHPPLIPYWIRVFTHLFGEQITGLHLAFLPFTLLASLALGYLVRRFTGHHPALALAITLGPLFLPIATNLMTDAALFAFWFAALACLDRALVRPEFASFQGLAACLMAVCAFFTSYQGLGLLAVFPLLGLAHGKPRQAATWAGLALVPFLLWLLMVWWRYGIFPYFSTPHANVSIASEVNTGLDPANMWLKARVTILYLGAGLGCFLPVALRGKSPWYWLAATGWGVALAAFLFETHRLTDWLYPALLLTLGLPALVVLAKATRNLRTQGGERWIEAALLCCFAGFALFQIAFAAFAAPRYILILVAALFLLLLRHDEGLRNSKTSWLMLAATVSLGLLVTWADWHYARAQQLERLDLPADLPITFVGEKGMKYSGERLGYRYFMAEDEYEVAYLLMPREIDHIAVPSGLLQDRAEEMARFKIESALPIRVMNRQANAGLYIHTRGLLPFAFSTASLEEFVLYRCYQPGNPDWQMREYQARAAGHILPDTPIYQDFTCIRDGLTRLELFLATGARRNQSTLVVTLAELGASGGSETVVQQWVLAAADLEDNRWQRLTFPAQRSQGKRYRVHLSSPDATPQSAMTIWSNSNTANVFHRGEETIVGALGIRALCLPSFKP